MAGSLTEVIRHPNYGTGKTVAYTGTAGDVTVPGYTQSVVVWVTTIAYVRIGATATTTDFPLPANTPVVIPVNNPTGAPITVSAIQAASGGSLYCIGMAE